MNIDPLSLERLEDHKAKEYFKIDQEWVDKIRRFNPEGYAELVYGWKDAEAEAKFWREFEKDKTSNRLSGKEGWSEIPSLIVPGLLHGQMTRRFGPEWGRYNFLRYGIYQFYPKLRTTKKWYGRKKGIDKKHLTDDFNKKENHV